MALRLFYKLTALPETRGMATIKEKTIPRKTIVSDYDRQNIKSSSNTKSSSWIPKSKYGGRTAVSMLPGFGIGPECMGHVKKILNYIGAPVDFEEIDIDPNVNKVEDMAHAISSIRRTAVGLKGNIETKKKRAYVTTRHMELHNELDMFAYVLNAQTYPGIETRHKNVNITVVRQNTEGEYAQLEHEFIPGVVQDMKIVTTEHTTRLTEFAFEYARKHKRKKVTTVHKADIMKISDGHFLRVSQDVARKYPSIEHNNLIVDNCAMQLVSNPHQFDVMLTTNLQGSMISNVLCGMCGGCGLFSGGNYSDRCAVFEPAVRSSGTSIAGKNTANPIAMINAAIKMLKHLGHYSHAEMIRRAMLRTINVDKILTPDVGGTATSEAVVKKIMENITYR